MFIVDITHIILLDTPKNDENKKPAKIEITIKPQPGTELKSGIKVWLLPSQLIKYMNEYVI